MIPFTIRLVRRSTKWIAPYFLLLVWVLIGTGGGGTGLALSSMLFPAWLIVSVWLTIITGNIDDDPHRDLLAAAAGSASRLHILRAVSVLVAVMCSSVPVTVLVAVVAQPGQSTLTVALTSTTMCASAAFIGIGVGTCLHRPLIRHAGLSTLLGVSATLGVMLLPPVQHVHRSLNRGQAFPTLPLLLAAVAWSVSMMLLASQVTLRRAR
jgi:hypothetical protein